MLYFSAVDDIDIDINKMFKNWIGTHLLPLQVIIAVSINHWFPFVLIIYYQFKTHCTTHTCSLLSEVLPMSPIIVKNRNCQSFGCMIICLVYSNFPVLYCCNFYIANLEVNILTHLYHTVFVIKLLFLHKYLSFDVIQWRFHQYVWGEETSPK